MSPLPPEFYRQPTLEVARALLGCEFRCSSAGVTAGGRIVEVEAYHQHGDEASHSFIGRTRRNAVMFGPGGSLYVYFTYGMHYCANVVTEPEGVGAAVLIRAVEPVAGLDAMRARRGERVRERDLTNGPAKLCQAFGITMEMNGLPIDGGVLGIDAGGLRNHERIAVSTRVGITKSRDLPWRFYLDGNPWVSRGTPSV